MKPKQLKKLLEKNNFFDKIFYLRQYHDARLADATPIDHYINVGIKENRKPNESFDPEWYLSNYSDVKENGVNPVIHFLLHGQKEGRLQSENEAKTSAEVESTSNPGRIEQKASKNPTVFFYFEEFDPQFYLSSNLDVKAAGVDPWEHFNCNGWIEGRQPNAWFDTNYYLQENPDIKANNINPFEHYKLFGKQEGRAPNGYINPEQLHKIIGTNCFDEEYYLNQYEDVRDSGINPLYHYLTSGYKEHRNPSVAFDSFYYMEQYGVDQCPLLHYIENKENSTLPDNVIIFDPKENEKFESDKKIAIQIHMFYTDIAPQIKQYLSNMPAGTDLLVSVMTIADKIYIENFFADIKNAKNIYVEVVQNIGRDISPLLITFKEAWLEYDYLCHIHTKRSLHADFGDLWRTYLFDSLLGSKQCIVNSINYLENHNDVSIVYPENYFEIKKFTTLDDCTPEINQVLTKLGLPEEESYVGYPFAAGTMQWFRTSHFKDLIDLNFQYDDFKETNTKLDGTLAHAMERLFAIFAIKKGSKVIQFRSQSSNKGLITESRQYSLSHIVGDKWMRDDPKISANISKNLSPAHQYYNKDSLTIHWVIPDFGIGAGGHMTIFRMVYFLEKLGHRQSIWIQNARNYKTPILAKQTIAKHYQPIGDQVDVHFLPDDTEWISGDIVFATDCWTAYPVRSMSKFKKRCYFIQDYEPMFHPMGENYLIAEQTYNFGFTAITAGKWLQKKAQDHGMTAYDFPLCADSSVYRANKTDKYRVKDKINIAFYSRSYTPRRAVKLGLAGLSELAQTHKNIHVHCFGQDDLPAAPDFEYTNHGILSPEELAELYNSCDVGMVFSATNYSLIPLEMMACGLAIVEMDVESTRYVFDENVVTFAQPNVASIAKAVGSLIDDQTKREQQIKAGLDFLKDISWKKAADNINQALYKELEKENFIGLDIDSITNSGFSADTHATVVIPTLNAEDEIERLLETILSQKTSFAFDVLVIDSESDDKTPDILASYTNAHENISYIGIQRKEFQHGKTRDMGIEKAQGDYVAFLTQDALPYDENWLEELIKGFLVDEKIVGIFGKHVAYEDHSPFVNRDISNHFKHFDMLPKVYSWHDRMPSHITRGSLEWQMKMMFYSDNNSAICKKAWKSIPYPHIAWGEDQVWAWTIVQLGLKKYYAQDAIVYHSHDDTYETRLKVSSIEKDFFYNNFGINLFTSKIQAQQVKQAQDQKDIKFGKQQGVSEDHMDKQIQLNEASILGRSGFSFTSRD
jgi:glycosyltransferase involved in cell wall biosynthesis